MRENLAVFGWSLGPQFLLSLPPSLPSLPLPLQPPRRCTPAHNHALMAEAGRGGWSLLESGACRACRASMPLPHASRIFERMTRMTLCVLPCVCATEDNRVPKERFLHGKNM